MHLSIAARSKWLLLGGLLSLCVMPLVAADDASTSSHRPLAPEYRIEPGGAVTQRLCFNWSCATRQVVSFSAADMSEVARQMAVCPGEALHERLQRLRIGIWQMEVLAQRQQPLLANDEAINDRDQAREGRMDCIDNASNTTTYLHVLRDLGLLPGWSMKAPEVRDLFSLDVHWTAVVTDRAGAGDWAVDSWLRPNGHLPFVLPLAAWVAGAAPWQPPLAGFNPTPHYSSELCGS